MLLWNRGEKGNKDAKDASAPPPAAQAPAAPAAAPSPAAPKASSLPDLLLAERKVTPEQLQQALKRQQETGEFIGEILIQDGILEENSLISFIAKHCKIPHLSLLDYLIDEQCLELIPKEICLRYRLLPIDRLGKNLTVAMVNPLDQEAMNAVRQHCPDLRIKPILCAFQHFEAVTARVFEDSSKGPVELSMSSFGLQRVPGQKASAGKSPAAPARQPAAPAPQKAPEPVKPPPAPPPPVPKPPAPQPEEDDIPEAIAVESEAPAVEPEAPPLDHDTMLRNVFSEPEAPPDEAPPPESGPAPPQEAAPANPMEESSMMRDMAAVMLNSMRDTYSMLARRVELFQGVDPEEVARIFARSATIEAAPDEIIFQKGEQADKMYAILGGEVQIEDEGRVLATLSRGDMLGEMALLSDAPRSASARATTNTSLLALDRETLQNAMSREVSTQLLINIIVTLSSRLRAVNERLGAP